MTTINWDDWSNSQWAGFPKNVMWTKIRGKAHDENGEPIPQFTEDRPLESVDTELFTELAKHRFTGLQTSGNATDFDGDSVASWPAHRQEVVDEFRGEGD